MARSQGGSISHVPINNNGVNFVKLCFKKFILRKRESIGGRVSEGEREFQTGSMLSAQMGHEIVTRAKNKSCTLNRLSHPGAEHPRSGVN